MDPSNHASVDELKESIPEQDVRDLTPVPRPDEHRDVRKSVGEVLGKNPVVHNVFRRVAKKRDTTIREMRGSDWTRALELSIIALADRNRKLEDKVQGLLENSVPT